MSKNILVVSAHPDDEVLGLGGTLKHHTVIGDSVSILIIASIGSTRYDKKTIQLIKNSALKSANHLGIDDVRFSDLNDQMLDSLPLITITKQIEKVINDVKPHIIYTHHFGDINRDHQIVHDATLTAARPYSTPFVEKIISYETPSSTEWSNTSIEKCFTPNMFTDISIFLEDKLKAVSEYSTELQPYPHPRSLEALENRAKYWGSIIGVRAAEPFVLVRELTKFLDY